MIKAGRLSWLTAVLCIFMSAKSFSQDLLISGGNAVSTIICANGNVFTWGTNTGGLLGHSTGTSPVMSPMPVSFPADAYFTSLGTALTIKAVDAGSGAHFIALDCREGAWSWGNNGGAIGITGTGSAALQTSVPARVLKGETPGGALIHASLTNYLVDVKYISGGNDNSYAILNTGEAVGWGQNSSGQVGDGTTTNATTPRYIRISNGSHLQNIIQIEAGDVTGYALVDADGDGIGTVYSWGSGANGRLGRNAAGTANGGSETANDSYARPVLRADGTPLDNIRVISAGDVMCFALDADGYIWAWGNGGWGDCTGVGVSGLTHSDPRRVVAGQWGTTAGPGFGEIYLKAKSISGGQGYGMAVTTNGIPVAWGNNGACGAAGGGNLGNGGGGQSGTPVFIKYGAGATDYHTNVVSISDGDTWGFYTTTTNQIYTWGNNNVGQLGIGSTTCQNYATAFSITAGTCDIPAPKPYASILPRDMSVCASAWTGTLLDSKFVIGAALDQDYRITWSRNGTPVQVLTADQAGALTYNATSVGTYHVMVEYIGTDAPCTPYTPAEDEITITAYTQDYTIPSGLTFCNTLTPYVNGTGMYRWYANASGGTALDTTTLNNPALIAKASVNAPVAGVYTVYVEEMALRAGQYGQVTPTNCASITTQDLWNTRNITFRTGNNSVILDTLSFYVRGETGAAQNYTWELNIYSTTVNNGHDVANTTAAGILYTSPIKTVLNPSNGGAWVLVKIPVNFTLAASTPYAIGFKSNHNAKIADFNCNLLGRIDNIATGGPYMTSTGSERNTNWSNNWGAIANVHFHTAPTFCDRVPVTLTESCPCAPPNSVTLNPTGTQTYCQGSALTIVGTTDISGLTPTNGYMYTWFKGATSLGSSAIYADLSFASLVPGDAATYKLRVEDGSAGNSACYREASVIVVVNATTLPGDIGTSHTICNGGTASTLTSVTAASGGNGTTYNYQWQSSTDNIAFTNVASAGTSTTYVPGALTQTTYFRRSVRSGTVCPIVYSDTVTVTVNPSLTSGAVSTDQSICSSTTPAALTETTAATGGSGTYTYQWQSSPNGSTGWTNIGSATAATYTPPTLTSTTYYRRVVSSGTCTAQNSNVVTITVLPGLVAGTIATTQNICYNTTPAALTSSAAASGGTGTYTYSWEESTNGGTSWSTIGGQTGLGYTPPALTATTLYRRVVVSGTGSCNTANTNPVTITVYNALTVGAISADQTICSGTTPNPIANATSPTGGSGSYGYIWEQSTNGGTLWTTVASANANSYSPPALTTTTMYRRVVSSSTCSPLTSATVTITVTPNVTPSVTINDPGPTCAGANMVFTATPTNGGSTPGYKWFVNGFEMVGFTTSSFNSTTLTDGSTVEVVMTPSICSSPTSANSNVVTVSVQSSVTTSVTISNPGKICVGTSVTFNILSSAGGGSTPNYQWKLNGVNVGTLGSTSYTNASLAAGNTVEVTMSSGLSCATPSSVTSNVITMDVVPIPAPQIVGSDATFCSGSSISYSSLNGGGSLTWNNNGSAVSSGSSITITNSGTYTLTEDNGACSTTSAPVTVTVIPTPIVSAGPDIYVKEGETFTLNATGATNYVWTPTTGLSNANIQSPSATATSTIEYIVTGYDGSNTCSSTDVVKVFVEKQIVIPNAFTPNGDNNNDGWEIANIESFPNCKIEVFNRWGNLVYKTTGYTMQWDGSNFRNGEVLPDGTYFYVIDLQSKIFTEPYTGYVQLVK